MNNRNELMKKSASFVDDGGFFTELAALVRHRTVSTNTANRLELNSYLTDKIAPKLEQLGFVTRIHPEWNGGANSFLIGRRIEDPELPTMLCYGHADVVDGHEGQWDKNRDPFILSAEGERWYGRGSADNKGQHLVNLKALEFLLEAHGSLGFNTVFLFESGEEIGSPDLAEFAAAHQEELAADVFIASDGPRLSAEAPTIFLGARGGVSFELTADLRSESYHSGNWGGLIRNPATTLAAAIGVLVDGHGRIKVPGLLPPSLPAAVRTALEGLQVGTGPNDPNMDTGWGDPELTPAERVYGWNALEVLAMGAADPQNPVNAIPGTASAILQLRFVVGTEVQDLQAKVQRALDEHGFPMVKATVLTSFPASRIEPDDPWVCWAAESLRESTGLPTTILPNIGGSLPNDVFESILGLPTLWIPHSYPGCLQHAPNEHLLEPIARQGLQLMCGLYYDLGIRGNSPFEPKVLTTHA
ncbi:M20 family metallopeptidase [Paeniglutamicibacter kerguelensis]|uniref:Acetylornithine deacetylase/succinyl-diaminopimelate desuccinylase-like protein n=1 Tax=Paeniglutamicibacter kerguelensis TaxID=254788 RepID=A0ABS4XFU8_9MICC|nr:acetylornithine deacetylase/succinyl-diaminopimelate desuccinylase-like protein [Paeniglutamicibacter kerguelensis]